MNIKFYIKTEFFERGNYCMENNNNGLENGIENLKNSKGLKKFAGIFNEFKEFISRGNVLDLAVGVIVGGAFTSIVNSLVDDILMPLVGTILFGINFKSLGFNIPWGNHPFINIGSFIQAIITFLLTALCVFFIVKIVNTVTHLGKKNEEPEEEKEPEVDVNTVLLTEIRDLLAKQNAAENDSEGTQPIDLSK